MNPDLVRYILENRDTYTHSAIVERLTAAGYWLSEIEAAWQAVESGAVDLASLETSASPTAVQPPVIPDDPLASPPASSPSATPQSGAPPSGGPPRRPSVAREPLFWATYVGYLVGFALLLYLSSYDDSGGVACLVGLIGLIGPIVAAVIIRQRIPAITLGLAYGLVTAIVVPFVVLFILAGVCIVALSLDENPIR
ncbi:MAG: hypothetical protein HY329_21140 [Chloroflexi bacterium]|nr:hypothetical protein [Chloroflexota bacterium]